MARATVDKNGFFGRTCILSGNDVSEYEEVALKAIHLAGQLLLDRSGQFTTREKGPKDLVTDVDLAAQQVIEQTIKSVFPDHAFLGEEGNRHPTDGATSWIAAQENCWIVDPLDGTTNYVHQLPFFAVSIALWQHGLPRLGLVLDPVREELFCASAGNGVTLNGDEISVSTTSDLSQALGAVSFPANIEDETDEVNRFVRALQHCRSLRRIGSAALNLSYLAAGRLDAYWASSVKSWDVAAGVLIVQEAGGLVTAIDGGDFQIDEPVIMATATGPLHASLLELFRAS
jgi:myo-inositol-1(or 4)-monophosphatase